MSDDEAEQGPDEAYCVSCGDVIPAASEFCPECGAEQTIAGSVDAEVDEPAAASGGFTDWAIGFRPGATGRNVLFGLGYFFFYFVGVPLLVYAYWRRGRKYKRRVYGAVGVVVVGFVLLAAIGAAAGPTDGSAATGTDGDASAADPTPTPTPEPSAEYAVRVRYAGSWQGALSVTGGGSSQTESISGTGSQTIEITGDAQIISANAQKQDDGTGRLTIQILHEGEVVSQASTTSAYGVAQTSQSV